MPGVSDCRCPQRQALGNATFKKETRHAKGFERKGRSYLGQERPSGEVEIKMGWKGPMSC